MVLKRVWSRDIDREFSLILLGLARLTARGRRILELDPNERRSMSKSTDTSKLDHAKLENRVLADSELAAVTGGRIPTQQKWADISMVRASDQSVSLWAWLTTSPP
jgi:hypothetical protein